MNKSEFLDKLKRSLQGLPDDAIADRVEFFSEMIDDLIEEGYSEEDAVAGIGEVVEDIANEMLADIPITKLIKERVKPKKRLKWWELTLIIVGFPLWFSLLAALVAVVIAVFASLWAVVISLWSVFASFAGCALGGFVLGAASIGSNEVLAGIASIGLGVASAGLAIFAFYGCKAVTKGMAWLTKKMLLGIKKAFIKKETV